MKNIKQLLPQAKTNASLLPSTVHNIPLITIKGDQQFMIENKYTLLTFSESKITFAYETGEIEIKGKQLKIHAMFPEELILQGTIEKITFT